jgi:hypothetical protein
LYTKRGRGEGGEEEEEEEKKKKEKMMMMMMMMMICSGRQCIYYNRWRKQIIYYSEISRVVPKCPSVKGRPETK